jgi:hypothetical protein
MVASEFAGAQNKSFKVDTMALPPEIRYSENQFSGLQIAHQKLYLMSECLLQDKREAKLYSTNLSTIAAYQKNTNQKTIFEKLNDYP